MRQATEDNRPLLPAPCLAGPVRLRVFRARAAPSVTVRRGAQIMRRRESAFHRSYVKKEGGA